jgi:hypothetical protein
VRTAAGDRGARFILAAIDDSGRGRSPASHRDGNLIPRPALPGDARTARDKSLRSKSGRKVPMERCVAT